MADKYSGQPVLLDPIKITDDYLNRNDWRVQENSTSQFSLGGLNGHLSGTITANYWLNKIYPDEISDAHKSCDFHIHDLAGLSPYCFYKEVQFCTKNGFISFEEAEKKGLKETLVLSYNEEKQIIEEKFATDIGLKGYDDLYQIELEDGTILKGFTKCHKFLTSNRGYIRAEELTDIDDIISFS
jgi:hypothetical protein